MQKSISFCILYIANTYTSANFGDKLTDTNKHILKMCTKHVLQYHADLNMTDLETAFSLATAGFIDTDIRVYYGKFNVAILGEVLREYKIYRNKIISKYYMIEADSKKFNDEIKKHKLREESAKLTVEEYQALKKKVNETLDFDDSEIKHYWAETLVKKGIIKFTQEEKDAIYKEAKANVFNSLASEIKNATSNNNHIKKVRHHMQTIMRDEITDSIKGKYYVEYCRLIIVKSLID